MSRKSARNKTKKTPAKVDPKILNANSVNDVLSKIKAVQQQAEATAPQTKPVDISKFHLHIGLPCYGGMLYESTMSGLIRFLMLAQKYGLAWSLDTMVNESLVQRARNNLMAKMMTNKQATHFMFIDSDISFDPMSIIGMIATEKDIIAGAYPKKALPISYNLNFQKQIKVQGPLFTVDTAATGFLMYKREVYQALIDAHPESKYVDDVGLGKQYEPMMYSIYDCPIDEKGHLLSEDWSFCRKAQKLGYDIWMDSRVALTHTGTHQYVGDISKITMPTEAVPMIPVVEMPTLDDPPMPIITETE